MIYLAVVLGVGIFVTRDTPKAAADTSAETTGTTPTKSHALVAFIALCVLAGLVLLVLMLIPFG